MKHFDVSNLISCMLNGENIMLELRIKLWSLFSPPVEEFAISHATPLKITEA